MKHGWRTGASSFGPLESKLGAAKKKTAAGKKQELSKTKNTAPVLVHTSYFSFSYLNRNILALV